MLVASLPMLAGFFRWERRLQRKGGWPLIPPMLFTIRSFRAGTSIAVLFFAGNSSVFFALVAGPGPVVDRYTHAFTVALLIAPAWPSRS